MSENEFEDSLIKIVTEALREGTESPEYSLLFTKFQEALKQMSEIIAEIVERVLMNFKSIIIEIDDYYGFSKLPRPQYKDFDKTMTKAYVTQPMKKYGFGYKRKSH